MPRTLCALALLGTLLSSLGPPSATPALLVVPDQYSTIQSAITAAAGGDSILVRAGTYVESLGWSGKDLTLLGEPPGTILTTNHTARVLDLGAGVTPATVLEGLVISDGQAEEGGGIRLRDGGSAQIRWCRFTSNRAASSQSTEGGAMYVDSGSVVIDDCFFGSNSAYNSTVSESAGGAIFATGANITIRRCTFDHNGASGFEGGPGGAIFLGGGVASLDSCTFSDNDGGTGAAIYSWACLTVTRSTFRGNFSGAGGSAIACDFGGRCAPGDGTPSAG